MQPTHQRDLEVLVVRLRDAFPELAEHEVHEAVTGALHDLESARLRQFVPLLVEKQAREACRRRRNTRSGLVPTPSRTGS